MTELKIRIHACHNPVIPACQPLRHPRMLLSGDLLKRPFKRSQTVWEIPDEYCVFSGMIGMKIVIPRMPPPPSSPHANPSVIPACQPLRHPRMLLSGDLLKRLFERSQTVWEIPDRYFVSSGMTGGRRSRLEGRDKHFVISVLGDSFLLIIRDVNPTYPSYSLRTALFTQ